MSAVLVLDDDEAAMAVASLRTLLLGGSYPPGARRILFGLVDALRDPSDDLPDVDEVRDLIAALRERGEP